MLRVANTKDDPQLVKQYIRQQFKIQATRIPVHSRYQIEWYVRHAINQLELMSSPNCNNITFMEVKTDRDPATRN